jgi:hypothetical protein
MGEDFFGFWIPARIRCGLDNLDRFGKTFRGARDVLRRSFLWLVTLDNGWPIAYGLNAGDGLFKRLTYQLSTVGQCAYRGDYG